MGLSQASLRFFVFLNFLWLSLLSGALARATISDVAPNIELATTIVSLNSCQDIKMLMRESLLIWLTVYAFTVY